MISVKNSGMIPVAEKVNDFKLVSNGLHMVTYLMDLRVL